MLISAAAIATASLVNAEVAAPIHISNSCINNMSPDGTIGVSQGYSTGAKILDLASGNLLYEIPSDEMENIGVGFGVGNGISNTGIVLISTDGFLAEYWKDGKIYTLDYPEEAIGNNSANGITPDGSRICGYVGVFGETENEDDVLRNLPCIWNFEGDNEYSKPIILPHPERDFTGRIPQYVMANYISEDGKTILGSLVDCVGYMSYPILWKEDENGEWSYEVIHEELYHPEGFEFPAFPGEWTGGNYPMPYDFMSEEEQAAYDAAYAAYEAGGYVGAEPNPADYMTQEEIDAYNEYSDQYNAWVDQFNAWLDAYSEYVAACPSFDMNSFHLSGNGKYMTTSASTPIDDPMEWRPVSSYSPWVFDLTEGTISKYTDIGNIMATYVADDGTVLATSASITDRQRFAYVIAGGNCLGMQEWIASKVPSYGTWISENMTFPVIIDSEWDEIHDRWIDTTEDMTLTGVPTGTPDLSKIGVWINNEWDFATESEAYIFDIEAGVNSVDRINAASEGKVIYDLSGRKLREISAPGIYIIDGKKTMVK